MHTYVARLMIIKKTHAVRKMLCLTVLCITSTSLTVI